MSRHYPSLYQIHTRAWLFQLGAASLDAVPDFELDRLEACGFDWVWLLGAWQTGEAGRAFSRRLFPNVPDEEVCGSPFAIVGYTVHRDFGGDGAMRRMRARLAKRGIRLMLDFVPNHTALDHPWTVSHPEFYVAGSEADLARTPQNYVRTASRILAHGRDPNYPGWEDTLQLDYANPRLQGAMIGELMRVAELCDGVRCDMAMLMVPEVFERTWGRRAASFWPVATQAVRTLYPTFLFLAEVYWDMEWDLQQQGFDFCYDKRLYDRLRSGNPGSVRDHLRAGLDYQSRLARFLENHDEPRAAHEFGDREFAAAVATYCAPGMRFFHQGQFEGRLIQASIHLRSIPAEEPRPEIERFYSWLTLRLPQGDWSLAEAEPASIIAYEWRDRVVAINYSETPVECRIRLGSSSGKNTFRDVLTNTPHSCIGGILTIPLPKWGYSLLA